MSLSYFIHDMYYIYICIIRMKILYLCILTEPVSWLICVFCSGAFGGTMMVHQWEWIFFNCYQLYIGIYIYMPFGTVGDTVRDVLAEITYTIANENHHLKFLIKAVGIRENHSSFSTII